MFQFQLILLKAANAIKKEVLKAVGNFMKKSLKLSIPSGFYKIVYMGHSGVKKLICDWTWDL
jgi:hypothetical protein